jgi:hypothetical protein
LNVGLCNPYARKTRPSADLIGRFISIHYPKSVSFNKRSSPENT